MAGPECSVCKKAYEDGEDVMILQPGKVRLGPRVVAFDEEGDVWSTCSLGCLIGLLKRLAPPGVVRVFANLEPGSSEYTEVPKPPPGPTDEPPLAS